MYVFKDYPYLKMNFDGVNIENERPFPVEIKVATFYGQKHYDPSKAIFSEFVVFEYSNMVGHHSVRLLILWRYSS